MEAETGELRLRPRVTKRHPSEKLGERPEQTQRNQPRRQHLDFGPLASPTERISSVSAATKGVVVVTLS